MRFVSRELVSIIVLFLPLPGEMIQVHECFSDGLKAPTRFGYEHPQQRWRCID